MDGTVESREPAAPRPAPAGGGQPLTTLLEHLARTGVISRQQAVDASEWKRRNDKDRRGLVEILEQVFGINPDPLRQAVAQYYAFRTVTLSDRNVRRLLPSDVQKLVRALPEATFQNVLRLKLLPFDIADNQPDKIILVTPNPADREIHDLARVFPYKRFEICYIKESEWTEYWKQVSSGGTREPVEQAPAPGPKVSDTDFETVIDREIARSKLPVQLDNILLDAVRSHASEIHFVARGPRKTEIFFRLEGHLSLWHSIEDVRCEAVATIIKERTTGVDRYERQAAQHGVIERTVENVPVRLTVAILPLHARIAETISESIVMRVHRDAEALPRIEDIACGPQVSTVLQNAMAASHGLLLFAGTARDGSTMTQVAVLRALLRRPLNAIVIQEQTRFIIDGARQVRLNPRLTADDAMEAIAGHDPDIVVLGDLVTLHAAHLAVRLANIGQLVLATLPVRNAVKAVTHLTSLTGLPFAVAEAVTGVIAQQSIRMLCSRCRKAHAEDARAGQLARLPMSLDPAALYRAVGCIDCRGGYAGKQTLYEAFAMTPEVRRAVVRAEGAPEDGAIEDAAAISGFVPMHRQARELLMQGATTIDELMSFLI